MPDSTEFYQLRYQHLHRNIRDAEELLEGYEHDLLLELERTRKKVILFRIEELKETLRQWHQECEELETKLGSSRVPQLAETGTHLQRLESSVDQVLAQQTSMGTPVFISHDRADMVYLEEMQKHFMPHIRAGALTLWDATRIQPGEPSKELLEQWLSVARVVILLVSSDYLASESFARDQQPRLLQSATEGSVRILPVILETCGFERTPLGVFQIVNDPDRPVRALSPNDRHRVWQKVVEETLHALQRMDQ